MPVPNGDSKELEMQLEAKSVREVSVGPAKDKEQLRQEMEQIQAKQGETGRHNKAAKRREEQQQQQQQKEQQEEDGATSQDEQDKKEPTWWQRYLAGLVRVHKRVVHEDHRDSKKQEHLFHEHTEITSEELFFDLIFVAIGIDLAGFLKADVSSRRLGETMVIFATAWLTWFHTNILLTRFRLGKVMPAFIFLIMFGTLGHAIHALEMTESGLAYSGFGNSDGLIFGSLFLTRLSFFLLYAIIMWRVPLSRPMLQKYTFVFFTTTALFLAAALCQDSTTAFTLWIVASVLELLMYPLALLTPYEHQLTVNTAHLLERNQLWVILILGESIISIASAQHTRDAEYYVVVIAAFVLVYFLMKFHLKSQHLLDERAEEHALDHSPLLAFAFDTLHLVITSGMLVMAVGIKLAIAYSSTPEKYTRVHAWTLTVPLGLTLFTMNVSSLLHKMRPLTLCGQRTSRLHILVVEAVLSLTIIPLALLVEENDSANKKSRRGLGQDMATRFMGALGAVPATAANGTSSDGATYDADHRLDPAALLPIVACILAVMFLVEWMLVVEEDEEEEDYLLSVGTQTDLTTFQYQGDVVDGHGRRRLWQSVDVRRHRHDSDRAHHHHHGLLHFFRHSSHHHYHYHGEEHERYHHHHHDGEHHHWLHWNFHPGHWLRRRRSSSRHRDSGHHADQTMTGSHPNIAGAGFESATSAPGSGHMTPVDGGPQSSALRNVTSVPSLAKLSSEAAEQEQRRQRQRPATTSIGTSTDAPSATGRRRGSRAAVPPALGSVAEIDAGPAAGSGGGDSRRQRPKSVGAHRAQGGEAPWEAQLQRAMPPPNAPLRTVQADPELRRRVYAESAPSTRRHSPRRGSHTPMHAGGGAKAVRFDSGELQSGLMLKLGGADSRHSSAADVAHHSGDQETVTPRTDSTVGSSESVHAVRRITSFPSKSQSLQNVHGTAQQPPAQWSVRDSTAAGIHTALPAPGHMAQTPSVETTASNAPHAAAQGGEDHARQEEGSGVLRGSKSEGNMARWWSRGRHGTPPRRRRHMRRHMSALEAEFEQEAHEEAFFMVDNSEVQTVHTPLRREISAVRDSERQQQPPADTLVTVVGQEEEHDMRPVFAEGHHVADDDDDGNDDHHGGGGGGGYEVDDRASDRSADSESLGGLVLPRRAQGEPLAVPTDDNEDSARVQVIARSATQGEGPIVPVQAHTTAHVAAVAVPPQTVHEWLMNDEGPFREPDFAGEQQGGANGRGLASTGPDAADGAEAQAREQTVRLDDADSDPNDSSQDTTISIV